MLFQSIVISIDWFLYDQPWCLFFNLEPKKKLIKQKTQCSPKPCRKELIRSQTENAPAVPPISKAMEDSIKNQRDNSNLDVGSQRLVSFVINAEAYQTSMMEMFN